MLLFLAPPGWAGRVSSAGTEKSVPIGFISVPWGNHLLVVDPSDGSFVTRIYAGSAPSGLRVLPDGKRIWSRQAGSGNATLIEAATGKIDVLAEGDALFAPDGRRFYSIDPGGITEVDATSWTVLSRTSLPHPPIFRASLTPDGGKLLILPLAPDEAPAPNAGGDSLLVWSTATRRIEARIAAGPAPRDLVLTPDGRFALVACPAESTVRVIDLASAETVVRVPCGLRVRRVLVSPDGSRVVALGDAPHETTPSDDTSGAGARAEQTARVGGAVASFRADFPKKGDLPPSFRPESSVRLQVPIESGAITPDGTRVYVLGVRGGNALILDASTLRTLREIPGAAGREIVWALVPRQAVAQLRTEGAALRSASRNVLRTIFVRERGYSDLTLTEEVKEYGPDGKFRDGYDETRRVKAGGLVREDSKHGVTVWWWGRLLKTSREDPLHAGDWLADFVYLWRTAGLDVALPALAGDPGETPGPSPGEPREPHAGVAVDIAHKGEQNGRPFFVIGSASGDTTSTQIEVDSDTGFPLRATLHRPSDPAVYVTRFDEYRVVDGHWIPDKTSDWIDGRLVRRRSFTSALYDTGLKDEKLLGP